MEKHKTDLEFIKSKLLEVRHNLDSAKDDVDMILDEETEARDNMPESLQDTERYYQSERL